MKDPCSKGMFESTLKTTGWICAITGLKVDTDRKVCGLCQKMSVPENKKGRTYHKDLNASFDEEKLRWDTPPSIQKCWKGQDPEWNPKGATFQGQLWCPTFEKYINPDGTTCAFCREENFPTSLVLERAIRHIQSTAFTENRQEALARIELVLTKALQQKEITLEEAYALVDTIQVDDEEEEKEEKKDESNEKEIGGDQVQS